MVTVVFNYVRINVGDLCVGARFIQSSSLTFDPAPQLMRADAMTSRTPSRWRCLVFIHFK